MSDATDTILSRDAFLGRLRAEGEKRYHDRHPHMALHCVLLHSFLK